MIYQGHVLTELKKIATESVHAEITSPPFWGKRDYPGEDQIWENHLKDSCDDHRWGENINSVGSRSNDSNKNKNKILRDSFPNSNFCINCGAWKGQFGLEPHYDLYLDHWMEIATELKRVLRKDGSLWIEIGDTYYGGGNAQGHSGLTKNAGTSTLKRNSVQNPVARGKLLPRKTLVGIPVRLATRMIDSGWILRNTVIWNRPNPMPSPHKDRFTEDFTYFFFFTKSVKYYFEQQFEPLNIKEVEYRKELRKDKKYNLKEYNRMPYSKYSTPKEETINRQGMNKERGSKMITKRNLPDQKKFVDWLRTNLPDREEIAKITRNRISTVEHWYRYDTSGFSYPSPKDWSRLIIEAVGIYHDPFPELTNVWEEPDTIESSENGRNMRTTWTIPTKGFPGAHFAVFPEKLIVTPIKACVPKGGVVLDPFFGSGTTGVVAEKFGRKWIGIELNPEYVEMATKRIQETKTEIAKQKLIEKYQNAL